MGFGEWAIWGQSCWDGVRACGEYVEAWGDNVVGKMLGHVGTVLGHVGMGYGVRTHRDIWQWKQVLMSVQLSGNTGTKQVLSSLPSLITLLV